MPCLAADADTKNQADKNVPRPHGTPLTTQVDSATPRPTEGADKRPAASTKAFAAAKADYQAAVERCDAQPAGERNTCMQVAKDAQSLAMNKARNGAK